jgi:hypothetical protein
LFRELFDLDREGLALATQCDPEIRTLVKSAIERTMIGGSALVQLFNTDRSQMARRGTGAVDNRDQQAIIDIVGDRVPRAAKAIEAANLQTLLTLMCRRQAILRRIREDIRLHGWLKVWLYVHVPLTIALLLALVIHIVTTFIYW